MGPVLTAVVVAARAGSAMAAEIGSMKVTEQVDALRALAVDPVQYLVVPRLVAAVVMLPAITILADVVGTAGGYIVAVINGVPGGSFMSSLQSFVDPGDVTKGLLKTVFFGATIAIVGCYEGLQTTGGATGVGRSTTRAVVLSIVLIYISNFFLAYVLFGGRTAGV
jgi:phospholipid/cholesterol/gamma-HCH transport system permease protein